MEKKKNIQHKKPTMTLDKLATLIQNEFDIFEKNSRSDHEKIMTEFKLKQALSV